jgi:Ca2+-binding EF-hand superfamily protein
MKNVVKIIKLSFMVAGSLSVLGSALIAQDLPSKGPIEFSSYDTNKDGFVSEQEFNDLRAIRMEEKAQTGMPMKNAGNAPSFSMFDTNKDGKLTELELVKGQNNHMQNNQKNKGMGQNSMKPKGNMPNFEDFDLNNDGMISPNEMEELKEKRMEQNALDGKMMKNIGNQSAFSDIDTNNDGNISKEEFLAHQTKKRQ